MRRMTRLSANLATMVLLAVTAVAGEKPESTVMSVVDAGSFGIIVQGRRVATETFKVEQSASFNRLSSELKSDAGSSAVTQTSELDLTPMGALKRYTWKETAPSKSQIVVEPQDANFLTMRISENPNAPSRDTTHALTPATSILDSNFYSHMELLAWKYMAIVCRPMPESGGSLCGQDKQKLPILVPRVQDSGLITVEFTGEQKIAMKGVQQRYKTFKLTTENGEWSLWLNEQNKLVRVIIPSENTEVVRD